MRVYNSSSSVGDRHGRLNEATYLSRQRRTEHARSLALAKQDCLLARLVLWVLVQAWGALAFILLRATASALRISWLLQGHPDG
jgi:hypothetical protein